MSIAVFLKNNLGNIPCEIGKYLNYIPYSFRPGISTVYRRRRREIFATAAAGSKQNQRFVFERVKALVDHAYSNVRFYREYYDRMLFHPRYLKAFSDISSIPIISKAILNEYRLEDRSVSTKGRYTVNTGGSSGTPFVFYVEPSSIGHEWAHMHMIWEKLGYKSSDLKVVFGGRSSVRDFLEYDVVRNHFAFDIYAPYWAVCKKLSSTIQSHSVKYLHGYPSTIYDFALYCDAYDKELAKQLRRSLRGVFLGSEFPHKYYRETIERVFGVPTISWYGHTERAVLAYEGKEHFLYEPFLSYGFSEAILNEQGEYNLLGTSYYNYASPLIRYNTEDIVENPEVEDGILRSFQILKGRSGEFVVDRSGKKINLTGLIFGRHHEIFNYTSFIQIKQVERGQIEVYFVSDSLSETEAEPLFDTENLDFYISFKKVSEPIRSMSGKVGLLIK